MKNVLAPTSPQRLVKLAAFVLITAPLPAAMAQQTGYSADEFYRQGDAFSERVSGFFARLFKPGSQPTNYQQPAQPQANYAQPGAYRAPAPAATGAQQPYRYPQAATANQQPPATARTWPNYAQPQAPNYQMAPPAKSGSIAPTGSMAAKKTTTNSSTRKPVFSTTNKTSTPATTSREKEPDSMPYVAPKESVVKAPTQTKESSPYSLSANEPDPLPKQSFSDSSGSASSKVTSGQSFPVATPGKTPGRVISPYPPNKELDVKGLPSGSLALDPTTQKVFKVP
jgi:hypothetical protein